MIEGKGLGGKRINRVNVSLSNAYESKLRRLATACNLRPTTLAAILIETSLDDVMLVTELQKEHSVHGAYRVLPVQHSGQIEYVLNQG